MNQEETTAMSEDQLEEAENKFDEGFDLSAEGDEQDGNVTQPEEPQEGGESTPYVEQTEPEEPVSTPDVTQAPPFQQEEESLPTQPLPQQQEAQAVKTVEIPEDIADEYETLKTLNPDAAALALEDSPEGATVRSRLEQYGAELAQDRAEQVLFQRRQVQALRQAQIEREKQIKEAHNRAFRNMFEREHPEYAAMLFNPNRKAEAARYQQDVFRWIEAMPYSEAAGLMEIAKNGRDPAQVSALLTRFERERNAGRRQPDPTGALAVPGRGAPVAPTGIGDKDDFDAGWNANQ